MPRRSTLSSTSTQLSAICSATNTRSNINAELMQSTVEIATPVCRDVGEAETELRALRKTVCDVAGARGLRVGSSGTHPFSLFERQQITARDRYRALVDQLQYIARRELIFGMHVHVAVDGPEKAIQVVNGLLNNMSRAPRPVRELTVLARRADGTRVEPPDGLRSVPALRAAAALRRLRGLRRGRRPPRAHRLHRRLHAHLVGRPPAPAARDGRDPHLRRGHAGRGRRRDHRVLPGARQALLGALRRRARRSRRTTGSSRPRTSGSPRATAWRRR